MNLEPPRDPTGKMSIEPTAVNEPVSEPSPEAPAVAVPAPPLPVPPEVSPEPNPLSSESEGDMAFLRKKDLLIPVEGVSASRLNDSFLDSRSEGRLHLAIDIMAPQGTAVLAAADGKVLKLYQSERGGVMLYQQDSKGPYIYYYGHLLRYADGIHEGKNVNRGETIAYVGDTGNAGPGNYHLHFGISRVDRPGIWSGGVPINPYPLLTE
jgi:murein DD-endopeptidase MepM/ murein hydrolase activator NlpD